jgi:hypothetical protein
MVCILTAKEAYVTTHPAHLVVKLPGIRFRIVKNWNEQLAIVAGIEAPETAGTTTCFLYLLLILQMNFNNEALNYSISSPEILAGQRNANVVEDNFTEFNLAASHCGNIQDTNPFTVQVLHKILEAQVFKQVLGKTSRPLLCTVNAVVIILIAGKRPGGHRGFLGYPNTRPPIKRVAFNRTRLRNVCMISIQ